MCTICGLVHYFIMAFWKVPSKNLYAMKQTNLAEPLDHGDESDKELTPCATKRFREEIKENVNEIKEEFKTLKSILLPNCLRDQMIGLMRCCVCQVVPIQPQILIAKYCNSMIGCEQCVEQMIASCHPSRC